MFEKIKEILIDEMNIEPEKIVPETELITGLGMNSLELADLIVMCEDRFGIVFEDEDLASLLTLGDVASYIEAHV
ncbi:MAG: acyl carrier protein [Oscillospiraceae bacterium]|nr:acyl carrier protein [Oscillospiraceae bacterium]